MNISTMASTVILVTSFATIFLFAIIFYLYGGGYNSLKDALSMTASFFGGIATLVAAYIATQLFNDWKEQHDKQIDNKFIMDVINAFEVFDSDTSLVTLMFNDYDIKFNYSSFSEGGLIDLDEHINPIIKKTINLIIPLSKLKAHFEYYELINNKTKNDEFEKVILNIRDGIYRLNTLDNTFGSKYEYLKDQLMPLLSKKIWFLEDNYINPLRASLKVKSQ